MKTLLYKLLSMVSALMPKKRAVILLYHDVGASDLYLTVNEKRFKEQMRYLSEKKYTVISLESLCRLLIDGREIPQKTVVLTFDDGYLSHGGVVVDTLEKYGFHGTFFIATRSIGDFIDNSEQKPQRVLSHQDIQRLERSPSADVEPHSVTHREFTSLSSKECQEEISMSKKEMDTMLKKDSTLFAYPRGMYSSIHMEMLRRLGFSGAVTVDEGLVKKGDDRYALARNTIHSGTSLSLFKVQINPAVVILCRIKQAFQVLRW